MCHIHSTADLLTGMHGTQELEKDENVGYIRRLANLDFEDKVEVKALQVRTKPETSTSHPET